MNTKTELRARLKTARLEMLEEEHRLASQAIVERLKKMDWTSVKSLHFFEPLSKLMEVDISDFLTALEDNCPKMQLSTSRLIEDEWTVVGVKGGQPPEQFDVVIVPMLGFDPKTRHRIGYGGGYYDKFLATQKKARKVGVCFEQGKVEISDESYDIPLDLIITEKAEA